jgi:hypothetical protein
VGAAGFGRGGVALPPGGPTPAVGCTARAPTPAALLPRAADGCVDFGAGLR